VNRRTPTYTLNEAMKARAAVAKSGLANTPTRMRTPSTRAKRRTMPPRATPSAVPFGAALGVALGGMVLRFALVLGVLILVGVFARPDFATAALAFIASFSVYVGVRLFSYPPAQGTAHQAGAQ